MSKTIQKKTEYHYPVKIVCGKPSPEAEQDSIVADGRYFTAVNIHNPSLTETVRFRRRVAVALPGANAGPVTEYLEAQLRPCEALEIDCPDIFRQVAKKLGFIKGFLVIESPHELDIVAVYTAADKCCDGVVSFHTERVPPRKILAPCKPLKMGLNTGKADWRAIQRPGAAPGSLNVAADIVPDTGTDPSGNHKPGGWKDITGALWVTSGKYDKGDYRFKLCFDLCEGFKDARVQLEVRTDNAGKVLLNGTQIGTTAATSYKDPATQIEVTDQSSFVVGENCLEVAFNNSSGPAGFVLKGLATSA